MLTSTAASNLNQKTPNKGTPNQFKPDVSAGKCSINSMSTTTESAMLYNAVLMLKDRSESRDFRPSCKPTPKLGDVLKLT